MPRDLLPLDEATNRLRPSGRRYVGIRPIELSRIVGTDSRSADFDRDFSERRRDVRERRRDVERAFPDGDFPPIVVHKLGDAYFVIDGHHRVAAARRRRMQTIDAEVTELTARWHLHADADLIELVHAEQERIFMLESGLVDVLPNARIRFTRPVGYLQLLDAIQVHGYRLTLDAQRPLRRGDVARDWYTRIYLPTLEVIHDELLDEVCPDATDPDRFLWVYGRRHDLAVAYGPHELSDAARRATRELARSRRGVRKLLRRSRPD